jgi:glycosyltransferase involved in cell wall biosynthesis
MGNPWLTVLMPMPAHNEETGLEGPVSPVTSPLSQLRVASEILIVDNCDTDREGEIADALAERHARNHLTGQGGLPDSLLDCTPPEAATVGEIRNGATQWNELTTARR